MSGLHIVAGSKFSLVVELADFWVRICGAASSFGVERQHACFGCLWLLRTQEGLLGEASRLWPRHAWGMSDASHALISGGW